MRHNDFLRMFCAISPRNTHISLFLNSRIHPAALGVRQFCRIAMMPCMMMSCFKVAYTMKVIVEYGRMVSTLWRLATRLPHCGTCLHDGLHYSMATWYRQYDILVYCRVYRRFWSPRCLCCGFTKAYLICISRCGAWHSVSYTRQSLSVDVIVQWDTMLQITVHGKVVCSRLPSIYMHTHLHKRISRHYDVDCLQVRNHDVDCLNVRHHYVYCIYVRHHVVDCLKVRHHDVYCIYVRHRVVDCLKVIRCWQISGTKSPCNWW